MVYKTRIILKQANELKKFFFIMPSDDGSIYFGSSIPKPKEMRVFNFQIPANENSGTVKFKFDDAENIEPRTGKFSYHPPFSYPSSIIHLKTDKGNKIFEYNVSRLETINEYRKLFIVVPKNPTTFPNFTKTKSKYDIVIPIDGFNGNPFCVDVYICKKDYDYKQLLSSEEIGVTGICENKDYVLVIKLYRKNQFTSWPRLNSFIPYVDGIDMKIDSVP